MLDSHVERETEVGNNLCTGYCFSDRYVERETELGNNGSTNQILLLGLPCRKGNSVREQLPNEPDIAVVTAM